MPALPFWDIFSQNFLASLTKVVSLLPVEIGSGLSHSGFLFFARCKGALDTVSSKSNLPCHLQRARVSLLLRTWKEQVLDLRLGYLFLYMKIVSREKKATSSSQLFRASKVLKLKEKYWGIL